MVIVSNKEDLLGVELYEFFNKSGIPCILMNLIDYALLYSFHSHTREESLTQSVIYFRSPVFQFDTTNADQFFLYDEIYAMGWALALTHTCKVINRPNMQGFLQKKNYLLDECLNYSIVFTDHGIVNRTKSSHDVKYPSPYSSGIDGEMKQSNSKKKKIIQVYVVFDEAWAHQDDLSQCCLSASLKVCKRYGYDCALVTWEVDSYGALMNCLQVDPGAYIAGKPQRKEIFFKSILNKVFK